MKKLLCAALLLILAMPVSAESLWYRNQPYSGYLFVDNRARNVGDLLTIVVNETTGIGNKDKRDMEKKTDTGFKFNFAGKTSGNENSRKAEADASSQLNSNRKFEGKADYTSDRRILDKITVVVVAIQPNGNLLVEGYRKRVIANEERTMKITGIVRPIDVAPNNIIDSQFVGNFEIAYQNKGPESKYINHGWLGKLNNVVWPF